MTSDGVAVVTAPELITVFGPTLHVSARGPGAIFVGVAHQGDLDSYLADQRRTTLTAVARPDTAQTSDRDGSATVTPAGLGVAALAVLVFVLTRRRTKAPTTEAKP